MDLYSFSLLLWCTGVAHDITSGWGYRCNKAHFWPHLTTEVTLLRLACCSNLIYAIYLIHPQCTCGRWNQLIYICLYIRRTAPHAERVQQQVTARFPLCWQLMRLDACCDKFSGLHSALTHLMKSIESNGAGSLNRTWSLCMSSIHSILTYIRAVMSVFIPTGMNTDSSELLWEQTSPKITTHPSQTLISMSWGKRVRVFSQVNGGVLNSSVIREYSFLFNFPTNLTEHFWVIF